MKGSTQARVTGRAAAGRAEAQEWKGQEEGAWRLAVPRPSAPHQRRVGDAKVDTVLAVLACEERWVEA